MVNCSWCHVILSLFLVRGRRLISVCMRKEVLPTGIDHDPVPDPEVAILLTITEDLPLRATSRPHAMLCHGIAHLREDTFRHTTAHHLVIIGRKSHHLEELDDYFFVVCFCNSTFYFILFLFCFLKTSGLLIAHTIFISWLKTFHGQEPLNNLLLPTVLFFGGVFLFVKHPYVIRKQNYVLTFCEITIWPLCNILEVSFIKKFGSAMSNI